MAQLTDLLDAESADRMSRHVAHLLARVIDAAPERERAAEGVRLASALLGRLQSFAGANLDVDQDVPTEPGRVLHALLRLRPDGTPDPIELPLTPLLDTTVLTNAPGEPAVGHELRAEIPSADAIDVVMAFVRWSGVRPMLDALRRHCESGKSRAGPHDDVHEQHGAARARRALAELGAEVRVSYDTTSTRLHAKAWLFHRQRAATRPRTSDRPT